MLQHSNSDPETHLILCIDVFPEVVGAVLQQRASDIITPIAFFSQRPLPAQEHELLAIDMAAKHFTFQLHRR